MIRCPHCKSYAIENTGRILMSYPSYTVYKCTNCGKEFNICNNETVPKYDLTKSTDVTELMKVDFFRSILETGEIPNYLNYYNKGYYLFRVFNHNYYYRLKDNNEFIHLHIEDDIISEADSLFEQLQDFYEKIKELK